MSGKSIGNLYEREKQNKQKTGSETLIQFAINDIMIKFYLILKNA